LTPDGQTIHGDHAYVQYQIPVGARKYPIVMWHGGGQFTKTWETTPDGRDGFQNIFLRSGYTRARTGHQHSSKRPPTGSNLNEEFQGDCHKLSRNDHG
jgi:hypothetical protein